MFLIETPQSSKKRGREDPDLLHLKDKKLYVQNMRYRRTLLAQWEATNKDLCWLVIWLAFREKGTVKDFPTPTLSHEWTNFRRWARTFMKSHSNVTGNPYNTIYDASKDDILLVHYLDDIGNTTWPLTTCPAPLTVPETALCVAALAPRIDRFASLP